MLVSFYRSWQTHSITGSQIIPNEQHPLRRLQERTPISPNNRINMKLASTLTTKNAHRDKSHFP